MFLTILSLLLESWLARGDDQAGLCSCQGVHLFIYFIFLVNRVDIIITTSNKTLQPAYRGQRIGNMPIIIQPIFIRVKQNTHINRGGRIKHNKIFLHSTAPFSQKVGALIHLFIYMPHPDLHKSCYEVPAVIQQRGVTPVRTFSTIEQLHNHLSIKFHV